MTYRWIYKVVRDAENISLDEMLREVMEKERERIEEEREHITWYGSYQEAVMALRV